MHSSKSDDLKFIQSFLNCEVALFLFVLRFSLILRTYELFSFFSSLPFHLLSNENYQTIKSELVHMHSSKSDNLKFIQSFPNYEVYLFLVMLRFSLIPKAYGLFSFFLSFLFHSINIYPCLLGFKHNYSNKYWYNNDEIKVI